MPASGTTAGAAAAGALDAEPVSYQWAAVGPTGAVPSGRAGCGGGGGAVAGRTEPVGIAEAEARAAALDDMVAEGAAGSAERAARAAGAGCADGGGPVDDARP